MLATLEQFVKLDLPFLPRGARQRASRSCKDMMTRADVSVSEKYRRIVEAYQIEMEYGRTHRSLPGQGRTTRPVDFLRAGRVALMYQTLDGKETGYWDADAKKWRRDDDYRRRHQGRPQGRARSRRRPISSTVAVPAPKEIQLMNRRTSTHALAVLLAC